MEEIPEIPQNREENEKSLSGEREFGRKVQLFELLVFLFMFMPSMLISMFIIEKYAFSFRMLVVRTISSDLSIVSLIWYFVWRNGEGTARIGWILIGKMKEIVYGILLIVPYFILLAAVGAAIAIALHLFGVKIPQPQLPGFLIPSSAADYWIAIPLVIIVAFSEETMFRGYLMLRLGNITGNARLALVLQGILFGLMHGYKGAFGMAITVIMGILLGLVYQWRKSLVAPMVMHFLQDIIALVVIPLVIKGHGPV